VFITQLLRSAYSDALNVFYFVHIQASITLATTLKFINYI